ncbi:MAG: spore germination protein [Firmicutes bacterium]|nr:spore germination protein [Bacillota bacterium]
MGFFKKEKKGTEQQGIEQQNIEIKGDKEKIHCKLSLYENINIVKEILKDCGDVIYKDFAIGKNQNLKFTIIYIDGMSDNEILLNGILRPLMLHSREIPPEVPKSGDKLYDLVRYGTIIASEMDETTDINKAILSILIGDTVLFIDGIDKIIIIGTKGWPTRSVEEPSTETVIRGPRDGFVETIRMNTALVRRRIRDPRLKLKQMQIGRRSQTDIGIFYIEDIVKQELLDEVIRRMETIDIDAVLDSGYIEQLIEDNPYSPFPQIIATERPDEVAGELYEGRVVVLVDNSPFALIIPTTLNSLYQSPEDYYDRWIIATILRFIRIFSSFLALILPSLYVVFTSFHTGVLPTKLVLSIAASREGVPFPAVIEAFIMEFTLELLREAGLRLPAAIGNTISIVGGLIIGEAAVRAGIVSPIKVIIVALTAIASFANPSYNVSVGFRLLRFALIAASGMLGLYGLMLGLILIIVHLIKLKSFDIPYFSPLAAFIPSEFKDTLYRAPLFNMIKRPLSTAVNEIRMKNNRNAIKDKEGEKDND